MAYHAKSQKTYNDKCNRIVLKYTEKETNDYIKVIEYCKDNNIAVSTYIKSLIKRDINARV